MTAKKRKTGIVYSTDPDFNYEYEQEEVVRTLPPEQQNLKISIDQKHRGGKIVTLVQNFEGNNEDLKDLAKILKTKCGVGGSSKDGTIIIQGDHKEKVCSILEKLNYKVRILK
jgi:translation initiation factor 1